MHRLRSLALLASIALTASAAEAAPGDVVVPAHRAADGTLIPANVPPSSGGTAMPVQSGSKVPARTARPVGRGKSAAAPVPLFVEAQSIRR